MKKINIFLSILFGILLIGCDELPDEQFEKYAVITRNGYHEWAIPYNDGSDMTTYISVAVSGTSILSEDMGVEIAVNSELLDDYNFEKFRNETSSYYDLLPADCYELETMTATIKSGDEYALIPLKLKLEKMNKYKNYILPVEIVSVTKNSVGINGYNQSLINVVLENDYSGNYTMAVDMSSSEGNLFINTDQALRTVDANTSFFQVPYLSKSTEKADYIINMEVAADSTLVLYANNPDIEFTFATPNKEKDREANIVQITESEKKTKTIKFFLDYSYLDKSNPDIPAIRRNIRGYFLREVKLD
jgi:hypothetical protein